VVADQFGTLGTATYAGFRKRVGAWIIDTIIVAIVLNILGALLSGSGVGVVPTEVVGFMIGLLYFAGMESSSKQATLGKMTLGIVVTDREGNRITFMRATGRYLAKITSTLTLLMGYIMVAFTHRKQGLHDIIAQTLVVNGRR
jgi:uncharacterized RDD family membrane protein YckC